MRARTRTALLSAGACVALLAGCAGTPTPPAPTKTEAATTEGGETGSETANLEFRSWSPIAQTTESMIAATVAKFPEVAVNAEVFNYPEYLVDLNTRASSNTMPDIVGLQPGAMTQQYRTHLQPLNQCAEDTWGADWEKMFFPIGLEQARMGNPEGDDNYYALPILTQTVNLWQNVQLMGEKGLEAPTTWDELAAASAAFEGSGKAGFLLPAKDAWLRIVVFLQIANNVSPGHPGQAEIGEAKWTDAEIVKALEYWQRLFDDGIAQPGALALDAYPSGANQFEAGDAAMIPLGAWWIQQSDPAKTDAPPLSQGLQGFSPFLFPTIPGGAAESQLVGGVDVALGISTDSKNPEAACKVLTDWIAGAGAQVLINTFNDLPAVEGLNPEKFTSDHQREVWEKMMGWMPNVKYSRYMLTPEMDQKLGDVLAGVAAGDLTPADAAQQLQDEQDKVLGGS